MEDDIQERLRRLPKVDALLLHPSAEKLMRLHGRALVVDAARAVVSAWRERAMAVGPNGELSTDTAADVAAEAALDAIEKWLAAAAVPSLRRVVNATGIVLHTNLGRAPVSADAIRAIEQAATGYSNLEFDLASGKRGSRQVHVEALLARLTQADAALVVNNNAAAVMLAVNTVARDGEVVTSRGEVIEIGGSFRIPDVIEASEARLVETGTTNRTRVGDFARAITPMTRALLRVHPSNYRITGFTESPTREQIVALAHEHRVVAIEDLGSGTLVDLRQYGLVAEPTVQDAVRAGMDVVTFSGDKLLGGPQAGIAVGRGDVIAQMKRNPLYRALRVDKLTLAALEATLRAYLDPDTVANRVPVLRMLAQTPTELEARATRLAEALSTRGFEAQVRAVQSFAGGGALPEEALEDSAVALRVNGLRPDQVQRQLRAGDPPVVARVSEGWVLLHMRTVHELDLPLIATAVSRLVS